ncbi:dual specificity protein phosphatase -related [Anaeramoeba flamelloides]|uniref:protein-tyrosine-phosphatase n=1 Tax=Anaeramoeba flamelloides TaxID=1746091 RepID=A0ABQ8XQ52_9EUKA|nr:dual specificity protein phosphatase -related [Anaeramoeba flamelloides]
MSYSQISPLIYLGGIETDLMEIKSKGIKTILSLCGRSKFTRSNVFESKFYDLKPLCTSEQFIPICEGSSKYISKAISDSKKIYVHCSYGISRSPSILLYYYMTKEKKSLFEAYTLIKRNRTKINVDPYLLGLLSKVEQETFGSVSFKANYHLEIISLSYKCDIDYSTAEKAFLENDKNSSQAFLSLMKKRFNIQN